MKALTAVLSRLAIATASEEISSEAVAASKKLFLDSLGCALAARNEPGCREVAELAREESGREEATLLAYGDKVSLSQAVFANSVLTHALDFDDLHSQTSMHTSAMIFPACVSAAEAWGKTGRELLDAYVLGYEVASLLGLACVPKRRGHLFLPTSLEGGFGSVAALARLRGLGEEQCVQAMGIFYAQAAGNRQALIDQSLTKRLQPAFAVHSALRAVKLASMGITGPEFALEGECGLFRAYHDSPAPDAEALMRRTQDPWQIEHASIKNYPSCGANHSLVAAALKLKKAHVFDSHEIDKIVLNFGHTGVNKTVGEPFRLGDNPQVNAQFSAAYCVALALLRERQDLSAFTDDAIRQDREVLELATRVSFADPQMPVRCTPVAAMFPEWYGVAHEIRVILKGGRELFADQTPAETRDPKGQDWECVVQKFRSCLEYSDWPTGDRIIEACDCLESLDDIAFLMQNIHAFSDHKSPKHR